MKIKFLQLFTLFILFISTDVIANTDSLILKISQGLIAKSKSDSIHYSKLEKDVKLLTDSLLHRSEFCASCQKFNSLTCWHWVFILMPVFLAFIFLFWLMRRLVKDKFNFGEAISGKPIEIATLNKSGAPTTENKALPSTSRLLAFMTGISAIIIALSLTSYYAYYEIAECSRVMEFSGLWKILIGLGIGVIPYGINVWNGNEKENSNNIPK